MLSSMLLSVLDIFMICCVCIDLFHPAFANSVSWDRYEMTSFGGLKVKGQGHSVHNVL